MMEEAFALMGIGMGTVLLVLLIVIYFGRLMIYVINRLFPEKVVVKGADNQVEEGISPQVKEALSLAVQKWYGSEVVVKEIERLKK